MTFATSRQFTLERKPTYTGVCCKACYFAKSKRCVCKCGGALHGIGREIQHNRDLPDAFILDPEETKAAREELTELTCRWCNADLSKAAIRGYPHSAGWKIPKRKGRFWLYIRCPKCLYEWALWKLGKPR